MEAISLLKQATEICPNDAEPYYQIGLIYLNAEEGNPYLPNVNVNEEAFHHFRKAMELGFTPKADICDLMGTACFRMASYAEAIKWLEQAAIWLKEEGGRQPSTYFMAAEANEALGNSEEAIKWYELYKLHGFSSEEEEINRRIKNLRVLEENRKKSL